MGEFSANRVPSTEDQFAGLGIDQLSGLLSAELAGNDAGRLALAALVSLAKQREQLAADFEQLALIDPVTRLPNRTALIQRDKARAQIIPQQRGNMRERAGDVRRWVCVFVDLDGFKTVNDRLGHERGDRALFVCAAILLASTREGDEVLRVGGDEYAIFAGIRGDRPGLSLAERFATRFTGKLAAIHKRGRAVLALPKDFVIEEEDRLAASWLGASFGISCSEGPTLNRQAMLHEADTAMQIAKGERKLKQYFGVEARTREVQPVTVRLDAETHKWGMAASKAMGIEYTDLLNQAVTHGAFALFANRYNIRPVLIHGNKGYPIPPVDASHRVQSSDAQITFGLLAEIYDFVGRNVEGEEAIAGAFDASLAHGFRILGMMAVMQKTFGLGAHLGFSASPLESGGGRAAFSISPEDYRKTPSEGLPISESDLMFR